jgi:PAS domain S-box-containing protein
MTTERLEILLVEDDPLDARLIGDFLDRDAILFSITRVWKLPDFEEALRDASLDIILSDFRLPGFDGLEALAIARERRPEIPFLLLSGVLGEDAIVRALKEGATDFLVKSHLERLGPAVRRALEEKRERLARVRAEEALRTSNERYRLLFENSPAGVLLLDPSGQVVEGNRHLLDMLGLGQAELVGIRLEDLSSRLHAEPPLGQSDPRAAIQPLRPGDEVRLTDAWGQRRTVAIRCAMLRSDTSAGGTQFVFQDVTGRKESEERMLAQFEEIKRWQEVQLDREDRIRELKREINDLCERLGEPPRYPSQVGLPDAPLGEPWP